MPQALKTLARHVQNVEMAEVKAVRHSSTPIKDKLSYVSAMGRMHLHQQFNTAAMTGHLSARRWHNPQSWYDWTRSMALKVSLVGKLEECRLSKRFNNLSQPFEKMMQLQLKKITKITRDCHDTSIYDAALSQNCPMLSDALVDQWQKDLNILYQDFQQKTSFNKSSILLPAITAQHARDISALWLKTTVKDSQSMTVHDTSDPMCRGYGNDVHLGLPQSASTHDLKTYVQDSLHEIAGHVAYRQTLPNALALPDTSIDEATALFWEHFALKSPAMLRWLHTQLQDREILPRGVSYDAFYTAFNAPYLSTDRKSAYVLDYPFHILHRYDLSKALLDTPEKARHMPILWREIWARNGGDTAALHDDDCLQDIHPYVGYFGYYPGYLGGLLMAAAWWEDAQQAFPTLNTLLENGDFMPLQEWVHAKAATSNPQNTSVESFAKYQYDKLNVGLS